MCRTPDANAPAQKDGLPVKLNDKTLTLTRLLNAPGSTPFEKLRELRDFYFALADGKEGNGEHKPNLLKTNDGEKGAIGQNELAEKMRQTDLPITLASEDRGFEGNAGDAGVRGGAAGGKNGDEGKAGGNGKHDDEDKSKRKREKIPPELQPYTVSLRVLSLEPSKQYIPPEGLTILELLRLASSCATCVIANEGNENGKIDADACVIATIPYTTLEKAIYSDKYDLRQLAMALSEKGRGSVEIRKEGPEQDIIEGPRDPVETGKLLERIKKIIDSGDNHLIALRKIKQDLDGLRSEFMMSVNKFRQRTEKAAAELEGQLKAEQERMELKIQAVQNAVLPKAIVDILTRLSKTQAYAVAIGLTVAAVADHLEKTLGTHAGRIGAAIAKAAGWLLTAGGALTYAAQAAINGLQNRKIRKVRKDSNAYSTWLKAELDRKTKAVEKDLHRAIYVTLYFTAARFLEIFGEHYKSHTERMKEEVRKEAERKSIEAGLPVWIMHDGEVALGDNSEEGRLIRLMLGIVLQGNSWNNQN